MTAELRLAYSSPTTIHTHLSLVAARGIVVSVRAAGAACRARMVAAPPSGASGPRLLLEGLHQCTIPPGPVVVSYRHASVDYRFHSQLGARSAPGEAPLRLPRRILRRDQRLDRRIDCRGRAGFHAQLRWAEGAATGPVLDLSAHGLRVGGLAEAPPIDTWVELVPTLDGVEGARRAALVRHRGGTPGAALVGLQLSGQGLCDDSDLHGILRVLLQAPLGPSRSLD